MMVRRRRSPGKARWIFVSCSLLCVGLIATGYAATAGASAGKRTVSTKLPSWTIKVNKYIDNGSTKALKYKPVSSVKKKWSVCALFPDTFDAYWLAMDYGLVTEARRDNINLTVYDAGGYTHLSTQVTQMNTCIDQHFNAIIVGAIDATALNPEVQKAHSEGIKVFDIANGLNDKIDGHARDSFVILAKTATKYLIAHNKGKKLNILVVPGPKGPVFASDAIKGIRQAVKSDPLAKVVGLRQGDTDATTTQGLMQDGLTAYPQTNAIVTFDSGANTAVVTLKALHKTHKVQVVGFMIVPPDWTDIQQGTLLGCPTDFTPYLGRIAIDLAVRTLQHQKTLANTVSTVPFFVSKKSMKKIKKSSVFGPSRFKFVYNVHAK
jgi:periplasmic protein TorT